MSAAEEGRRVAVIGATGLVGREIVSLLSERDFPVAELRLYASERSAGEEIEFLGEPVRVERLIRELAPVDVAFLCATPEVSREMAEGLVAEGAIVVDLTPAYRADPNVPFLIPTAEPRARAPGEGILVAVPDAPTILLAAPLGAIASLRPLRRIVATILLSASAFGSGSVGTLGRASAALLNVQDPEESNGPVIAFSCRPLAGPEREARFAVERDLARLLGTQIPITATLIRTPTFHGQAASVSVEIAAPLSREEIRAVLRESPSLLLEADDQPSGSRDIVGSEAIHLVALGVEEGEPAWVHLWLTADNLRQGAALNAVAVAEMLQRSRLQS